MDTKRTKIANTIGHAIEMIDLALPPRRDTCVSIMSYDHPENLATKTYFTDSDIAAMQSIWGVEDE